METRTDVFLHLDHMVLMAADTCSHVNAPSVVTYMKTFHVNIISLISLISVP